MQFQIHNMGPEDMDGKGYVHWKSWQETYTGLIEPQYIANQSLEKCQDIAHRWPENTLVAELGGKIVGFSCYGRNDAGLGEIFAIYLLKEAQGLGLGRRLMDAAVQHLDNDSTVVLWVLKGNDHAIGFYEHYGFRLDGAVQTIPIGTELRLTYHRA